MPVRLKCGSDRTLVLDGTTLPSVSASYLVSLAAGRNGCCRAECRSQVKAWDLIGCFSDSLTEEEKRSIDKELDAPLADGYDPAQDPMVDDEGDSDPVVYCAGIDASTVNNRRIAAKVWSWNQRERQARHLYITNGVPSADISLADWERVWGHSAKDKAWHDERGSVLYSLNCTFYTTDPGQFYRIKTSVAANGALDQAGNGANRRESTVENVTIDKDGRVSGSRFMAVPHKEPSIYKASPNLPKAKRLTRFERFYPIYRDSIAEIVAERDKREADFNDSMRAEIQRNRLELVGHETEILARLRASSTKRPLPQIQFEGESLENRLCQPDSDASAHLFAAMIRENLVTKDMVVGRTASIARPLSRGWVALVIDAVKDADPQSGLWKNASEVLYVSENGDEYRSALEKRASDGDAIILYHLMFEQDKETGLWHVQRSDANDLLLKRLSGHVPKPTIRAVCAAYAAATGRTELAESIGIEVCALPYIGPQSADQDARPSSEDEELYAARYGIGYYPGVLDTLFHRVRTEKAFRAVLDRSDAERGIRFGSEPVPAYWRKLNGYFLADEELRLADGFISELKDYQKRHGN